MKLCPYCQSEITFTIGRTTTCPKCKKELHTCKTCKYYSPGIHWDCRESIDELVQDKDRGNFCDFFELTASPIKNTDNTDKAAEARKKLEALFG